MNSSSLPSRPLQNPLSVDRVACYRMYACTCVFVRVWPCLCARARHLFFSLRERRWCPSNVSTFALNSIGTIPAGTAALTLVPVSLKPPSAYTAFQTRERSPRWTSVRRSVTNTINGVPFGGQQEKNEARNFNATRRTRTRAHVHVWHPQYAHPRTQYNPTGFDIRSPPSTIITAIIDSYILWSLLLSFYLLLCILLLSLMLLLIVRFFLVSCFSVIKYNLLNIGTMLLGLACFRWTREFINRVLRDVSRRASIGDAVYSRALFTNLSFL